MTLSSLRRGCERRSVAQHRPQDVDPATSQDDQGLSVSLAFGPLALVEGSEFRHPAIVYRRSLIRRSVSTPSRVEPPHALELGRVVGNAVLPHPPDHPYPRPAQYADGVWVVAASGPGMQVDVPRPGIVVAAGVREDRQGVAQPLVAGVSDGPEAAVVDTGQLGQAEGVEGIRLAADGRKARAGGLQPVGVDREHHEARFQQTPHQNAVWTLDRNTLYASSCESWRLAGAVTVPMWMPFASTAVERLMPRFPLSTGLLPAF